jgi:hypothetical protein
MTRPYAGGAAKLRNSNLHFASGSGHVARLIRQKERAHTSHRINFGDSKLRASREETTRPDRHTFSAKILGQRNAEE